MNTPATKFLLGICLSLSLCAVAQNTDKSITYTGKMDNHKILLAAVNATELGALLHHFCALRCRLRKIFEQ